ncbi:polyhydroxyalkanoate depolymerase [Pseudorhodoferax sp.]|uniref:polyhydroxyalkanoate depolymerase n=1 Tax=Pseudorhodoferax sp. TaxID=1993553 RepID=UPI0039E4F7BC
MLYQAYQLQSDLMSPMRLLAQSLGALLWLPNTERSPLRALAAACTVFSRMRLTHQRPAYGIDEALVDGQTVPVAEEVVLKKPFGQLLHFRRAMPPRATPQPRMLLVAPLSGHFSTLLRDTVRTLLQDHDVYVTDWINARDVALRHGRFGLDDYVAYVIEFIAALGPGAHVMAVCQPCVAALAATALMAEDDHPAQPRSLTLMAGPVDCRINPTAVNTLATGRPIEWFEQNLISHVPLPHAGFMRRVYPGFVQLAAFMSMNLERHQHQYQDMYRALLDGDAQKAETIRGFYDEYLAVNDLPAEFYLETVEKVFQTHELPRGQLTWRGRKVDTRAIRRTALLTVEGERDDICAVGQTLAAQDLCSSVRPSRRLHHVQTGVGHYGVFSGRKWAQQIYPRVRDMVHSLAA